MKPSDIDGLSPDKAAQADGLLFAKEVRSVMGDPFADIDDILDSFHISIFELVDYALGIRLALETEERIRNAEASSERIREVISAVRFGASFFNA